MAVTLGLVMSMSKDAADIGIDCVLTSLTSLSAALPQGNPEFRQAGSLLKSVDEDIVRDGLVGVGAGAALIGVIGAITYAALRKR